MFIVCFVLCAADKARDSTITTDFAPRVLVIEDLHNIDVYSWSLTFHLTKTIKNTLFLLSTRPLPRPFPAAYNKILRSAATLPSVS